MLTAKEIRLFLMLAFDDSSAKYSAVSSFKYGKKVPKNFQEKVHFQEMIQDTLDDSTHLIVSSKKAKHHTVPAYKYEKPVALHSDSNEEFQKRHTYFTESVIKNSKTLRKHQEIKLFLVYWSNLHNLKSFGLKLIELYRVS